MIGLEGKVKAWEVLVISIIISPIIIITQGGEGVFIMS